MPRCVLLGFSGFGLPDDGEAAGLDKLAAMIRSQSKLSRGVFGCSDLPKVGDLARNGKWDPYGETQKRDRYAKTCRSIHRVRHNVSPDRFRVKFKCSDIISSGLSQRSRGFVAAGILHSRGRDISGFGNCPPIGTSRQFCKPSIGLGLCRSTSLSRDISRSTAAPCLPTGVLAAASVMARSNWPDGFCCRPPGSRRCPGGPCGKGLRKRLL